MSGQLRTPWLIRLTMSAFPRSFRDAHAAEMAEDYAEAQSKCSTRFARARLILATAADMVASGLRARRHVSRSSSLTRSDDGAREPTRFAITEALVRDVRYAARSLARRPGFTLIAVTTLALGIGANTAIFSVVNAVLLRPLEWVDPDGLAMVWAYREHDDPAARGSMSLPDLVDIAELPSVEAAVGFRSMTATVTSAGEPTLVDAARTTSSIMRAFRIRPFMGRDVTAEDNEVGRPDVVVVGYDYWRERLGGRADILGTTLELSELSYEIIGIAPAGFDFPDGAQLWVPRRIPPECGRGCHSLYVIARLADGAALETLASQLRVLARGLQDTYPDSNFGKRFRAMRLADDQVADVRRGLWFILGAVSLVLLIACANVANLLLVRGENRRTEVAVRSALGASRARLARHVLIESAILTAAGAAAGLALARGAITLVRALPAGTVPRIETVTLDENVLLFALAVSALVALLFGVGPALRHARLPAAKGLIADGRSAGGMRASRSRALLLAIEVALSVLLLTGTGLMLRSFDRLHSVELGFTPGHLARFRVALPNRYDSIEKIVAFYETLEEHLAALPGVVSVASAEGPPPGPVGVGGPVQVEGRPPAGPGAERMAWMHSITPSYFGTMRQTLLRGRSIAPSDRTGTLPIAVVSETFVDENFPNEDPIGKRFDVGADYGYAHTWTIVGVVGDVRSSLKARPRADVYVPLGQFGPGSLTVTMRSTADMTPSINSIRDALDAIDPALPVIGYETVDDVLRTSVASTRFYLLAVGTFATLAVVLACVGLYGVVAYIVAQRRCEIGIRIALGAQRNQIVWMALVQGLRPAIVGVVLGVGLALAFGRVVGNLLFEVSPHDPLTLFIVVAVLAIVVFAASLLPARRASRVDPAVALRES